MGKAVNQSPTTFHPSESHILAVLRDTALRLTNWTYRWVPDAWIVAIILTIIVFLMALIWGHTSLNGTLAAWGKGLW